MHFEKFQVFFMSLWQRLGGLIVQSKHLILHSPSKVPNLMNQFSSSQVYDVRIHHIHN